MNLLRYPTKRVRGYKTAWLSELRRQGLEIPANVTSLCDERRQRQEVADAEIITVQLTRGVYRALCSFQAYYAKRRDDQ